MWQRFTWADFRVIGYYLGSLIQVSTAMFAFPFITAIVCQEWKPATHYLFCAGITLIVGSLLRFSKINPGRLNRQQAMAVTGFAWILLAFIASLPLFLSGHYTCYMDALFDGVSGITTTGASIIQDLDHLSYADSMWRFTMHLFGGLGLVVVALSLGLFGRGGSASMYASEGRSERLVPNVVSTAREISKFSFLFIGIAVVLLTGICLFIGVNPRSAVLHSLWLAISGFMTGGFAPMQQSVGYYHSFVMEIVLMVLMTLGSINFVLHTELWKGRIKPFLLDMETKFMLFWLGSMTLLITASLSGSALFSALPALLRHVLFTVIAAFSTTGFTNVTSNQLTTAFSSGAFLAIALLMAVGGGAGSTAGGMKLNRIAIVIKSITSTIKQTLAPDSARVVVDYYHVGRHVLDEGVVKEAMTVFIVYVLTYIAAALAGILFGYDATLALFDGVAMASNGGITAGVVAAGMPKTLEAFYIILMWAGRLEYMTLIALLVEIAVTILPTRRRVIR